MYTMNNIDNRRAIREALAWAKMSYLEAANYLNTTPENVVEGRVGLWKIMTITESTDEQMYNWGHR